MVPRILRFFVVGALFAAFQVGTTWPAVAEESVWVQRGPFDTAEVFNLAIADKAYAATSGGVQILDPSTGQWSPATPRISSISAVFARPGSPIYAIADGRLLVSRDNAARWEAILPAADWIWAVTIDPSTPNAAYVSDYSRIWRTADGGASWLSTDLYGVGRLDVAPDGTVFAQGEAGIQHSTDGGASFRRIGINRRGEMSVGRESGRLYARASDVSCTSTDKGTTWDCGRPSHWVPWFVELPSAGPGGPVTLVGSPGGQRIFASEDFGRNWRQVGDLGAREWFRTLDAADGVAYVGTQRGVLRSLDRGVSWSPVNAGLSGAAIASVAVDPSSPSRLLASNYTASGPNVLRSTDGGRTWRESESRAPAGLGRVLFDVSHPGRIFGLPAISRGFLGSVMSNDDGASWERLDFDAFDLAVSRASGEVWAASGNGVQKTVDGQSWSIPAIGQAVYSLVFDGRDPSTLYAGSYEELLASGWGDYPEGGAVFVSRDGGETWARHDGLGATVSHLAADPTASGVVYAATSGGGILRSDDHGAHWQPSDPIQELSWADAIVADPVRSGVVYAAGGGRVFHSLDGARTWAPLGVGLEAPRVTGLAVSPDGRTLYASTYGGGLFDLDLGSPVGSGPCVPDDSRLCLIGARYAVTLAARRHNSTTWVPAPAHAVGDRTGYFAFPAFTGDANLPEVLVKMLGEGALGPGGASVFYSSLTSLRYVLTVVDTNTGLRRDYYSRTDAPFCGQADFPFPPAAAVFDPRAGVSSGAAELSLLGGRFVATLTARHPRSGASAAGQAVSLGERSGYFSLPSVTGDAALPEVLLKMVDYRAVSGRFWLFYTGLTSLDYTISLRDTVTGTVRTYQSPGDFCGEADTSIPAE